MKNTERPSAAPQGHDQYEEALSCPRCDSPHTKFCYYNNYSRSQPRHFCKACKRYWTRGGTLRNVPVGGGCRKNKRGARPPTAAATGLAAPVANTVPVSRSIAGQSSSSSLDRSLAYQGLPSSGRLQEIHALGFPLVQFDHAVGLPHLRSPKKAVNSDQGLSFPYEDVDDYGRLSYFDNNSVGAHQWQSLRTDDSSFMQAGAAETTMIQNDLFWPPQPECQIQPITDNHTSHLYSIDNS